MFRILTLPTSRLAPARAPARARALAPALALALTLTLAACTPPPPQLGVPLTGNWSLGQGLGVDTVYVVSLEEEKGTGTIIVEVDGMPLRKIEFKVVEPGKIQIEGAKHGPYEGETFSVAEIADIIQLADPPTELRFSNEAPEGITMDPNEEYVFCEGHFASIPLPFPLQRIPPDRRTALPFSSIVMDLDIEIPPGTEAKMTSDGPWGASPLVFTEPVHPTGHIRGLEINGHAIPLEDTALSEGMLRTQDFGSFEILMLGTGNNIEVRTTRAQLEQLQQHLTNKENPNP